MEKIDPRARWIFSILFLFSISMYWDMRFLLFFFTIAWIWYFLARVSFKETRRAWLMVTILLISMVVVNTIISGGGAAGVVQGIGHPLFSIHFTIPVIHWDVNYTLTIERAWFALCQLIRVWSISAIFIIIPFSMDPRLYGITFRRLGLNDRFAFSMELAFRYVPTLARDFAVTLDAQKARGYEIERVEGGLLTQIRRVAPMIIPVTMGSIIAGEDMVNAMDLRCFGLRLRTWIQQLTYQWHDYAVLIIAILMILSSILLRYVFHLGGFWVPPAILPG